MRPGQVGRTVDLPATIEALRAQLQSLRDGEVQLATTESPPAILNVDEQAEIARRILSQPLTLTLPGSAPYVNQFDVTASLLQDFFTPIPDYAPFRMEKHDPRIFDAEKAMKKYNRSANPSKEIDINKINNSFSLVIFSIICIRTCTH